jgi:hypothetical protein
VLHQHADGKNEAGQEKAESPGYEGRHAALYGLGRQGTAFQRLPALAPHAALFLSAPALIAPHFLAQVGKHPVMLALQDFHIVHGCLSKLLRFTRKKETAGDKVSPSSPPPQKDTYLLHPEAHMNKLKFRMLRRAFTGRVSCGYDYGLRNFFAGAAKFQARTTNCGPIDKTYG